MYRALKKAVGGWVGGFKGCSGTCTSAELRQVIEVGSVEKRGWRHQFGLWWWWGGGQAGV